MVCGYGRHGKDTVSEMLEMPFKSSSEVANEVVIYPHWGKHRYNSLQECFDDRHNYRQVWYDMIISFNKSDKARLGKMILKENDIYCGIRCIKEFMALKEQEVFDLAIWVDAGERHPPEPKSSCTMKAELCDIILTNNGSLADLQEKVNLVKVIIKLLGTIVSLTGAVLDQLNQVENQDNG